MQYSFDGYGTISYHSTQMGVLSTLEENNVIVNDPSSHSNFTVNSSWNSEILAVNDCGVSINGNLHVNGEQLATNSGLSNISKQVINNDIDIQNIQITLADLQARLTRLEDDNISLRNFIEENGLLKKFGEVMLEKYYG